MKKKINDFMFGSYCCLGGRFIAVILFYLLFLILHYDKNYLLMCDYYNMHADNFNSFLLFVFSDSFFLILFLPVVILAVSWKVYCFFNCDCLKLLKCENRTAVIWRYILYSLTALTGIMIYLMLGILVIGKMQHMHFTLDTAFLSNFVFTYISLFVIMLVYLFFAVIFSSEGMGIVGAMLPVLFELMIWKSHMHGLFAYTFFYNIVVQDDAPISIAQKIVFWTLSLLFLIGILLIVIQHVDLGISRNVKQAVRYIFNKYYMNPWLIGTAVWSCIYAAITYRISKNFYSSPGEFVYICFRGFLGFNIYDLIFYLGLCSPLWVYLVYYFSKFFTTFSVYMFMKTGGVLKYMLKCLINMLKYCVFYFVCMMFFAYIAGNYIYTGSGKTDIYKNLRNLSDGMAGILVDFVLTTLLLILFIMIIYLLCYRLEIAFVIGVGCHILCVIIGDLISYGKEFIPFTQNILLIRSDKYNILWARGFLCLALAVIYIIFCYLMKQKQEKILIGYYS